jgi:hypothetical protein
MSEAWIGLIASFITGILSLIGVYIANRKNQHLVEYRLGELEKKVDKHNNLIERTFKLEERIAVAENEIGDLKNK